MMIGDWRLCEPKRWEWQRSKRDRVKPRESRCL